MKTLGFVVRRTKDLRCRSASKCESWVNEAYGAGWLYAWPDSGWELEHLQRSLLWPYVNSYEGYRCPGDIGPPYYRPDSCHQITSYGMNGSACANGR
ncbi:MAG: hypothetical protein V3S01_10905, partial [Dehalococcoidia bacterium]